MIRARDSRHLQNLIGRFTTLKGAEIKKTIHADYRYRIVVKKDTWVKVLSELAQELDYSNFKDQAARSRDAVGSNYINALHEVWHVMYGLQEATR